MRCELCQNGEGAHLASAPAIEHLRHVLLVTAPVYDPVVCETCLARAFSHTPKLGVENTLLRST